MLNQESQTGHKSGFEEISRKSCRKFQQIGNEKRPSVDVSLWIGSRFANARERA